MTDVERAKPMTSVNPDSVPEEPESRPAEKVHNDYGADEIQVLEGLEAVRKRPGMYIGSTGARGLHHLVYEIVDNSVDEALAGYCDTIEVTILEDGGVRVDGDLGGVRQPTQHVATEARLAYLGLHPLQGDALIVEQRGTDRPGEFVPIETVTNSISPNGDEGVGAVRMTIDAAYLGVEEITVAAGSFTARRYALRWRADWPAADLWVRQEDALFLLMRWSLIPNWYELTAWTQEDLTA